MGDHVNLAAAGAQSRRYRIPPGATRTSIDVEHSTATTVAWGTAVLEVKYTVEMGRDRLGNDLENYISFSPAVEFTSATTGRRNASVSGVAAIRLDTTTADGGADPAALLHVRFE